MGAMAKRLSYSIFVLLVIYSSKGLTRGEDGARNHVPQSSVDTRHSTSDKLAKERSSTSAKRPIAAKRQTTGWFYGFGLVASQEIYQGYSVRAMPIPIIGFLGEQLRFFGPRLEYDFVELDNLTLFAHVTGRLQGYDESDSTLFAGMKRKHTLDGGFGVKIKHGDWRLEGTTFSDLLSNSNGTELKTKLSRNFRKGPFSIVPAVGLSYLSNDHVDYYYGVETEEAQALRPTYQGTNTHNTTLSLTVATPIFFGGMSRVMFANTWYGDTITDSPLVDENTGLSLRLFFSKFF